MERTKPPSKVRRSHIFSYVTESEREQIEAAARASEETLSSYVRDAVLEKVKRKGATA